MGEQTLWARRICELYANNTGPTGATKAAIVALIPMILGGDASTRIAFARVFSAGIILLLRHRGAENSAQEAEACITVALEAARKQVYLTPGELIRLVYSVVPSSSASGSKSSEVPSATS